MEKFRVMCQKKGTNKREKIQNRKNRTIKSKWITFKKALKISDELEKSNPKNEYPIIPSLEWYTKNSTFMIRKRKEENEGEQKMLTN